MSHFKAQDALPSLRLARRVFDKASRSFADARIVHDEARRRLLQRLELVRLVPRTILDLGCADGEGVIELARRYPRARVLAIDSSYPMLVEARRRCAPHRAAWALCGEAERLPLHAHSAELIFANLLLPWCRPEAVFSEAARVLCDGGLVLFATLGPDSLQQVRRAWAGIDDQIHVHAFFDMHDLGDLAMAAGLQEPVMDVDRIEISYTNVQSLISDLRACGAINIAAGRRRTLTGSARWRGFEEALLAGRREGRFTITIELIFGQAWGGAGAKRLSKTATEEVVIPIERLQRG